MKVGDLVISKESNNYLQQDLDFGLVLEVKVNMWGEEVEPSGVRILTVTGDIEVFYEDEIEVINEMD